MNVQIARGLEGVVVDQTAISNVEGDCGRLSYRGYLIEDLVTRRYEDVVWLVIFGELPDDDQRQELESFLRANRELAGHETTILQAIPAGTHPMLMLQAMVPVLNLQAASGLPAPAGLDGDGLEGLVLVAKLPTLIATYRAMQEGRLPEKDETGTYNQYFLRHFLGREPGPEEIRIMDTAQILQMEHSFNAGTFAGRVTASTLAPLRSAVSSSIGTLYGPLHGGADEAALRTALEVGSPENADDFVMRKLAAKEKVMGMGHREYRTVDPRAKVLKPMAKDLCTGTEYARIYETLEAIEAAFRREMEKKGKQIWANVDFYKGAVYHALGIPEVWFTAMFALSRTVGYVAHFLESRADNKLIRPKAFYAGQDIRPL